MLNTTYRIECINPILYVKDMATSLHFYVDLLGFTAAEWGDDTFTSINRDNTGIYLCKGGQGQPGTWIWLGFDGDIYALHAALQSHNIPIRMPPTNFSYALEMHVLDPDGHVIRFGTDPLPQIPTPPDHPIKI
ncbi:MAG: VOC family protein [Bacteroidetes bacterium]|nr:VOC family protein [Bacteroidota bacterium]